MPLRFMLLIPLLLVGCSDNPEPASTPPPPVKLATVSGADGALRHFPGKVVATEGSQLAFRVSGQLVALPIRAGEPVTEGQLLARIDDSSFRNQLKDQQAQYDLAESQYQRGISLQERGVISQAQFDELQARRQQAEAALQQARDNLRYTRLNAPYAGTIARTLVENHQFVQAQEPIVYLQSSEFIDIEFSVPERFISNLREGSEQYQPEVRFEGAPERVFRASYKEHEASAGARTQAYSITLTMANPEGLFVLPGMSVDVAVDTSQIMRDSDARPTVPVEAIFTRDGEQGSYLWRFDADSSTVALTQVTLGTVVGHGVEILSGVIAGDQVVAAGVSYLEDGQQVRVLDKERGL